MENSEETKEEIKEQQTSQLAPDRGPDLDPIFEKIEAIAKEHGIEEFVFAFAVKGGKQPLVFWDNPNGGHYYDAASLLASVMRDFKGKIVQELDC